MTKYKLEYIWLDGYTPVPNLRGKTQIKEFAEFPTLEQLPLWGFDGSSTQQAEGHSSDCVLKPVAVYPDPARTNGVLVMCEVMMPDGVTPHASNKRATILDDAGAWFDSANFVQHPKRRHVLQTRAFIRLVVPEPCPWLQPALPRKGELLVARRLPETERWAEPLVYLYDDAESFVRQVQRAVAERTPALALERRRAAEGESWDRRAAELLEALEAEEHGRTRTNTD